MSALETGSSDEASSTAATHQLKKDLTKAFTATLIFYALVGPPVGFLGVLLLFDAINLYHLVWSNIEFHLLHSIRCPTMMRDDCAYLNLAIAVAPHDWTVMGFALLGSYFFGFIPALLTGFAVAIGRVNIEQFRFRHALIIGSIIGIGLGAVIKLISIENHHDSSFTDFAAWIYMCAFATAVCWLISSRWWPRKSLVTDSRSRPREPVILENPRR